MTRSIIRATLSRATLSAIIVTALAHSAVAVPIQFQDDVLWQSDLTQFSQFGFSLDSYGDRMIVGALGATGAFQSSGAAYILERSPTTHKYSEVAKVWNSTPGTNQFAWKVAMHGDFAAAVSPYYAPPATPFNASGAVFVYERNAAGQWPEVNQLYASDGLQADAFGTALAASDQTLIVGAPNMRGSRGLNEGAAYIFERSASGGWSQSAKLTASNPGIFDQFGIAADVDGDIAVVGAQRTANVVGLTNRYGSAYVYERDANGAWTQQVELRPSDPTFRDAFGSSVAVSGDTIVVGAPGHEFNSQYPGAAYVFQRTNGQWLQTAKLSYLGNSFWYPSGFGQSVEIENNLMVISAANDFNASYDHRIIMAYERTASGQWVPKSQLKTNGFYGSGSSILPIAISGGTVAIADYFAAKGDVSTAGATMIFDQIVPEPTTLAGTLFSALIGLAAGVRRRGISGGSRLL